MQFRLGDPEIKFDTKMLTKDFIRKQTKKPIKIRAISHPLPFLLLTTLVSETS